jgi:phosphohistidine phosphatase SixA
MALKLIVVVRHGFYEGNQLTERGRKQIRNLAEVLADHLNGYKVALLSSSVKRARETSEILADRLGCPEIEEHACLFSKGFLDERQAGQVLQLIDDKAKTHEAVVLSTHLEFIDSFPTYWGTVKGFNIRRGLATPNGAARVVDVRTGEVQEIQSVS